MSQEFSQLETSSPDLSLADFDPEVCNKCGQCCHVPVRRGTKIEALRNVVCQFLKIDGDETTCSVYKDRIKRAPWCLSVAEAYAQRRLPKECPYVKDDKNYQNEETVEYMEEVAEKILLPIYLAKINGKPAKLWVGPMGE